MRSAIESTGEVDVSYLCKMWASSFPIEMVDRLHGFYMLTPDLSWEVREELRVLIDVCWKKRAVEMDEREAA